MPAPNALCKTILRNARDAENAVAHSGITLIKSYRAGLANVLTTAGRLMINSSGGGKSYAFASGSKVEDFAAALDEAEAIWIQYTSAQISLLLDQVPMKSALIRFACGS